MLGKNPDEVEGTFSLDTINRILFTHRAQQEARIAIAVKNKLDVQSVFAPTSLELRVDEE